LRYYFVSFAIYPFLTAKNAKKSTAKNAKIKGKRNHKKFTKLQEYDNVVTNISRSFKPGNLNDAH
ncbi:MAG: hypothetical protein AB1765_13545, partial [Candidatus Hydrogenedentota bacterium]